MKLLTETYLLDVARQIEEMGRKKRLVVFASGNAISGGSGFARLVQEMRRGVLQADIGAVVSSHFSGGVFKKARMLEIPFIHMEPPYSPEHYQEIVSEVNADFIALSGWIQLVCGLSPKHTINIHPAPLPAFGGKGMYRLAPHEAVIEAYRKGELTHSEVCMHFVTEKYDDGPVFFRRTEPIQLNDTPEILQRRMMVIELQWQAFITNLVVHNLISWDGIHPHSLRVPDWYTFHRPTDLTF
jgi:phosphoribosylglycinamide formyltransferase 1